MKDRYYDKIKKSALNIMWKLPKVCAQNRQFSFKYKVHKHGIITPTNSFKKKIPSEIKDYDLRKIVL